MWVLKKAVVHFGVMNFAERTLSSWWIVLEKFGREREEALLPGPIKGLAQFLLRIDTKVQPLTLLWILLSPFDFTHFFLSLSPDLSVWLNNTEA